MYAVRHALRTLARTPALTAVAVLSLALGVGANAAIFSVFRQLLLRPLPVRDPGRLVNLGSPGPKAGTTSSNTAGDTDAIFSYPMFRDLERAAAPRAALEGIAAHRGFEANLAVGGRTFDGRGVLVSGGYFPLLGLTPALGRLLGPADDRAVGGGPVAVLGYDYWNTKLGADAGVVGRAIVVNGRPLTVVGVAPRGFTGTTLANRPDVYVPITMRGAVLPGDPRFDDRKNYWAYLFGRLRPGATVDDARRQLDRVYRPIVADVEAPLQEGVSPRFVAEFRAKRIAVEPGARGQSEVHRRTRAPLTLLLATTGVVLLIACANVANLLLARGAGRAGEIAVRMSLGAGRARLVRQLLVESTALALLGGAAGLAVARWTLAGVAAILPTEAADTFVAALDWPAVLFAGAVSLATGLAFGVVPALQSTRPDLIAKVRSTAGQIAGGARGAARFRTGLVGSQIALSMALLVTAALLLRSLVNVSRADLGLAADRIVTFALSPERNGYSPARSAALFARVEAELAALPGVAGVAAARVPMLADDNWGTDVSVEGFRRGPDTDNNSRFNMVSPGYFRALGVSLRAGREFSDADRAGAPKVAIVNEAFARKFGLGRGAVGRRMADDNDGALDIEIVGVVPDLKYSSVKDTVPPVFYAPYRQDSTAGRLTFYVRTALRPEPLLRSAADVVKRLDPALPVEQLKTLPQQARENTFLDRMVGMLAGAFAGVATLLAAVGLYGVLAYSVAQRTREIGVRMALGAAAADVRRMVVRQVGRIVLAGGLVGLAAALAAGRAARSLLFELEGHDPIAIAAAAAVLAAVGAAAAYLPARRATRVEPTRALRYD
jgi:predicted permease